MDTHIWRPSRRSVLGLLGAVPLAGPLIAAPRTVRAASDAETGTSLGNEDGKWMNRQALAGYVELPSGRRLTFAAFVGIQSTSAEAAREMSKVTKQALGEIAAAAYSTQSS
ncbi:hypothetical protein ABZ897_56915 [Nonomuraea sp. NPDC046802]|uniref:hypothetical protein n=1 Tax=Nonomuraea sp. NPDC046802 TaxID=3154919 RepID=UPI0033F8EE58